MDFEKIYNATYGNVYRFFYYKSVEKATIEDLSHEVYIRFYKKFRERDLDDIESKKILYGFCSNIYKEWVRQSIKENKADLVDNIHIEEPEEEFSEGFEEKVTKQKQVLLQAMEKLNPKVKSILEYRFLHNMSRKEIAEKLNMNEKDVHTYQKRGIKYLKKYVGELDIE